MLLRVGIAMVLFAVALAAVFAVVVNLSVTREALAPAERKVQKLPVVSGDWPEPSGEEVAATQGSRYYPP